MPPLNPTVMLPKSGSMTGGYSEVEIALDASHAGWRLDRALAATVPSLSRERLKVLTKSGALTRDGKAVRDPAIKVKGDEHIPVEGAAILACNHVSFVDAVLLMAASPRPIYFVMDHRIFRFPVLGWMFKLAKAIPIASQKEDPAVYAAAFERAAQVLREGDLLAIFPEGAITKDGGLQEFKGGIMKVLERAKSDGVEPPVVPMALTNLWGSFFSRVEQGNAMVRPFRRGLFNRVGLNVGSPIPAAQVQPAALRERVAQLLAP